MLTKSKSTQHLVKSGKMRLHVNCTCAIGASLSLDVLFVAQIGIVLELFRTAAAQNSCQFVEKWAERGYYDESDIVLCVK